ncbi:MAG TPA: hypothetical protein VK348_03535 [Planctomycetota bacterium]|nr:hypothetical protein [Planctomycetota bacterium]
MPSAPHSFTLLLVLLSACSSAPPAGKADDSVAWMPASARSPLVLDDERQSPNVQSALLPGTRVQLLAPPRASKGIPLPDGTCLPPLNGVQQSGPVSRPPTAGPLPPVTGIQVDDSGLEWYEHEDGSLTMSRFVWRKDHKRWEAVTVHSIPAAKQ